MSHRFHHGPLVAQHTERAFPEPAVWGVLTLLVVLLAIGLAGCADSDWRHSAGEPEKTAVALPDLPPVEVPNPFFCPGTPT